MLTSAGKGKREKRVDFTSNLLSDDLVLHVFFYLSASDLAYCAAVNSKWTRLTRDRHLWKRLFLNRFRLPPKEQIPVGMMVNWKQKYRIQHNWQKGKCRIANLHLPVSASGTSIQLSQDMICISNDTTLEIWHMNESLIPNLLTRERSSTESVITVLKLEEQASNSHCSRLIAGYADGGFGCWEFGFTLQNNFECRETVRQVPLNQNSAQAVISIGTAYPMIITCTADMILSIFWVDLSSARLVHRLQSSVRWHPVEVSMEALQDSHPILWRATICFGMSVGIGGTTSLGIQELVLSKRAMVMSRHCSVLNHDRVFFETLDQANQSAAGISRTINSIAYSKRCVMTAHANNTIKQYELLSTAGKIELVYVRTLYGHNFGVGALSFDMTISRLVSSDRAGLKIWDLSRLDRPDNIDYLVPIHHLQNQSDLQELPPWHTEWLQFTEDKVAAIVRDTTSNLATVRVWSFA